MGHTVGGMALQEGSLDVGPLRNPMRCAPRKVHPHAQKMHTRVAAAMLFLTVSTPPHAGERTGELYI